MEAHELKGMNGRRALVEAWICDPFPDANGVVGLMFAEHQERPILAPHSAIREILPEPIKVGDRVTAVGIPGVAEVRHIDGDDAWLLYHETGIRNDAPISDLTLVEQGQ